MKSTTYTPKLRA